MSDIHLLLLPVLRWPKIVPAIERATWQISFDRSYIAGNGVA